MSSGPSNNLQASNQYGVNNPVQTFQPDPAQNFAMQAPPALSLPNLNPNMAGVNEPPLNPLLAQQNPELAKRFEALQMMQKPNAPFQPNTGGRYGGGRYGGGRYGGARTTGLLRR